MKLTVENINFSYESASVLRNISFEAQVGRVLGILGANGAGKSTLLRLLNGVIKPVGGSVMIDGDNISDYSATDLARIVAIVPQNSSLSFGFTVEEVVAMGRRPYIGMFGMLGAMDNDAIEKALIETGLIDLRNRPITQLSGGESQLVAVAKALAQEPEILLMDEATSSLDINHTSQILSIIKRRVLRDGLTVVAVIHNVNLAVTFCDEVAFIFNALLEAQGKPMDIISEDLLVKVYGINREMVRIHHNPFYVEPMFCV